MSTIEIDRVIARKIERLRVQCECSIDPFTRNLAKRLEHLMDGYCTLDAEDEMLYREQYRDNHLDLDDALAEIDVIIFSASRSIRTHHTFVQRLQEIFKRSDNELRAYRCFTLELFNRILTRRLLQ